RRPPACRADRAAVRVRQAPAGASAGEVPERGVQAWEHGDARLAWAGHDVRAASVLRAPRGHRARPTMWVMEGHSVISPDVLARYAADAAADVPGVHTKQRRGARVTGDEVEVHVVIDYGANIPEVAAEIQQRVIDYLVRMADMRPSSVNVVVDDVTR